MTMAHKTSLAKARKRADALDVRIRGIEAREHRLSVMRHHLENDRAFWRERVTFLEKERGSKHRGKR